MKRVLTTLAASLLLGCAPKAPEHPETALDEVGLRLAFNAPAEVTGLLPAGAAIEDAVEAVDPAEMRSVSITCSSADSAAALLLLRGLVIPVTVSTEGYAGRTSVGYTQDGLTWMPSYAWAIDGAAATVTASATVRNLTGRRWTVTGIILLDGSGDPVCGVQDTLVLPEGELRMTWWEARGAALPVTLVYGRPVPGQWSPLRPLLMSDPIGSLVGTIDMQPDLPIRTGDTLWVPAPEGIDLRETLEQFSAGYHAELEIRNDSDTPLTLRLSHPDVLPRGADFDETSGFDGLLDLEPGETATVEYSIVYR